ncbi:MAG: hypothetical protein U5K30_11995 [Acidimicrobiales bacterium]|nr:hypothetical protein [Acidimicrobiales bacterium]
MAAPEHVPTEPAVKIRSYASPPRRPDTWRVERPADFAGEQRQPAGERLGSQGPDQGYALKLAPLLQPELHLTDGEHARDAIAGIVAVGLKRASLLGRAPVIHDLRIGATLFGFLDPGADPELVRLRRELFEEVGHFHHYAELRHIADVVDPVVLRQTPDQVTARYQADWRDQLSLA